MKIAHNVSSIKIIIGTYTPQQKGTTSNVKK